jgi:hypothetical protein
MIIYDKVIRDFEEIERIEYEKIVKYTKYS